MSVQDLEERRKRARAAVEALVHELEAGSWLTARPDASFVPAADGERLDWVEACYAQMLEIRSRPPHLDHFERSYRPLHILSNVAGRLLARAFKGDPSELTRVVVTALEVPSIDRAPLLRFIERSAPPVTGALREALERLYARELTEERTPERRADIGCLEGLLGMGTTSAPQAGERWSDQALADLATMPAPSQNAWNELFAHARTTAARPSNAWLKAARSIIAAIGDSAFRERAVAWFALMEKPPEVPPDREAIGDVTYEFTDDPRRTASYKENEDILRGLVWACATFQDEAVARAVGDLAVVCFTKLPGIGAISAKVGNACVFTLGAAPGMDGVAQLGRLKTRVKYTVAKRLIEKALDAAAARTGLAKADLEEIAVPTFGLTLEEHLARRAGKGPSIAKKVAKDIENIEGAQRAHLEGLVGGAGARSWLVGDARERFLDHPLVAPIARRLIWHLRSGERDALATWDTDHFADVEGRALAWASADPAARASLWHPLGFPVDVVRAWRSRLEDLGITQPFKQAYREIYILTDAELETSTYSNRFAAHILRQHQMAALCRDRGWSYTLQGTGFDGSNVPVLRLPSAGLDAEFWVNVIEEGEESASGISVHVATDQMRFTRIEGGEPVPLREVPALVFSEVMRDVDLFVGVCSVGNDPTWRDRGAGDAHQAYWSSYAFGPLAETALTRRAALERLVPKLTIASRCELRDRFLIVRGDLRTYKIHLGSGNILMEPNDQYLCIVPDRKAGKQPAEGKGTPLLPYEGDGTLAVILSKALLLAADAKIKDPSIVRQITTSSTLTATA